MSPSSFNQTSSRHAMFDHAVIGPISTRAIACGLDRALSRAVLREPRPLPLRVALPLIAGLSLAIWAGIGLLLGVFTLG